MSKYTDMIKKRRSYYDLKADQVISDSQVEDLVKEVVQLTPDAYNMQSTKTVLLMGEKSKAFWEKVNETFDNKIDPDKQAGFENARATVLFFIDQKIVEEMADQFPKYAENFSKFSLHASGMAQINMWNAFRQEGLGASLQHYSPAIDEWVRQDYDLPASWTLIAQMPLGAIGSEPEAKDKHPIEERVKIFK